jgi:hypothetical protein
MYFSAMCKLGKNDCAGCPCSAAGILGVVSIRPFCLDRYLTYEIKLFLMSLITNTISAIST